MYQVVVSGAGPSGCIAAHRCVELGLKTLLIEKGALPRPKCCAGGLLLRAMRMLPFEMPSALVEKEITGFAVQMDAYRKEFKFGERVGVVVRRDRLDHFLAKKAEASGAELWEEAALETAIEREGELILKTKKGEVGAEALIIAEGVTSRSARSLFGPYPGRNLALGAEGDVSLPSDPSGMIEIHLIDTPTSHIDFRPSFPLNGWMFPHARGANIGVVGSRSRKERMLSSVDKIAESARSRYGELDWEGEIRFHPIPLRPRDRLHSLRSVAIGDAAGFANPITGEGMSYAFASGKLAAEAVSQGLQASKLKSALIRYEKDCGGIRRDLLAASMLSPVLHRLVGIVDTEKFFDDFHGRDELVGACMGIAKGEQDWRLLARLGLINFPSLFLSSLSSSS